MALPCSRRQRFGEIDISGLSSTCNCTALSVLSSIIKKVQRQKHPIEVYNYRNMVIVDFENTMTVSWRYLFRSVAYVPTNIPYTIDI